jgi:hypothetical protein
MKIDTKDHKTQSKVSVSKKGLLSLVASKLKGRNLFPEKVEDAKAYVRKLKKAQS